MSMHHLLASWGPLAIFVATFFEVETILLLAGMAAQQDYMRLDVAIVAAFLGSALGDQLWFHLGRRYGTAFLLRRPRWRATADRALRLLVRYQNLFILSFRFLWGVRLVSSFAIGMAEVSYRRFTLLNIVAALIWALSYGFGGYLFGESIDALAGGVVIVERLALGALALGLFAFFVWRQLHRRRARRLAEELIER
jgi:membrane protein DedA with SNARE-associated domain